MPHIYASGHPSSFIFDRRFHLSVLWILGLICGVSLSLHAGDLTSSLMRRACFSPASIVSLFCSGFLPILILIFAAASDIVILLYSGLFFRALSFGFLSMAVLMAFPASGWLIRSLLLFSGMMVDPMLLYLVLFQSHNRKRLSISAVALTLAYAGVIFAADHMYISPLLADVMIFYQG